MMVLRTCPECGIRFYAPDSSHQTRCWRCERRVTTAQAANEVAERLLGEVFPDGMPADL
jgi:uncharacterized paraquat-inducible protein A